MNERRRTRVRPAERSDADQIARVHVDTWRETYSELIPATFFDEGAFVTRREMWGRYLATAPRSSRLIVADKDGQIVGFAFAGVAEGFDAEKGHPPVRPTHLFSIYLLASEHGSGVGQSLLDAVLGEGPAQLWVARDNRRARAFYERNGFRHDDVEYVDPSLENLVELRYVR